MIEDFPANCCLVCDKQSQKERTFYRSSIDTSLWSNLLDWAYTLTSGVGPEFQVTKLYCSLSKLLREDALRQIQSRQFKLHFKCKQFVQKRHHRLAKRLSSDLSQTVEEELFPSNLETSTASEYSKDEEQAFRKMVEYVAQSQNHVEWPCLYRLYDQEMCDYHTQAKFLFHVSTSGEVIEKDNHKPPNFFPARQTSKVLKLTLPPHPTKAVANQFVLEAALSLHGVLSKHSDFFESFVSNLLNGCSMDFLPPTRQSINHVLSDLLQFNWLHRRPRDVSYHRHDVSKERSSLIALSFLLYAKTRSKQLITTLHSLVLSLSFCTCNQ
ncbi:hypothetical protein Ciccas_010610 [Cichlidogyrus casuarinus]|uniref:Uncharacterized protein n=1 Tax=Cichlidogyrus casuarinus TaxID=1844966 RepID=A0ABD2PU18_9PLAT